MYRFPFTVKMVNEIANIQNLDKIRLCIHAEAPVIEAWKRHFQINKNNFDIRLYEYKDSNYLNRVHTAQQTEFEYSCKLDDDVVISRHVWDYIIESLDLISDEHPIISPILTNGIPNVELFVRDFLNKNDQQIAHDIFLKSRIPVNQWGLDYTSINDKINKMSSWDGREYWDFVSVADTKWDVLPVPWH
jgi:hypothetical protein